MNPVYIGIASELELNLPDKKLDDVLRWEIKAEAKDIIPSASITISSDKETVCGSPVVLKNTP